MGRLGLLIHSTAGFIDPGWDGHVTLELSNVANLPITIYYGMKIGQISFMQMTEPASAPYGSDKLGSKYQGQRGPTPSRYWQNFAVVKILVTGRHGLRRARGSSMRCAPRDATSARSSAGRSAARTLRLSASSSRRATSPTPASLAPAADGCTHVVHLVAIIKGKPDDFERVMTRGTQNVIAAAKDAGVERFVLMSALGTTATTKDIVPYFGAKLAMEQDIARVRARVHDLPPELRLRRAAARSRRS